MKLAERQSQANAEQLNKTAQDLADTQTTLADTQNRLEAKTVEVETLLASSGHMKELEANLVEYVKENDRLKEEAERSAATMAQANALREKYEALKAKIEPFKDQLENYEAERDELMSQNKATAKNLMKLAAEHGKILGHQNHRQKIQHLVKIKEENVALMNEKSKLQSEVARLKKALNAQDKENNATAGSTRSRSRGGSMKVQQPKQQSAAGSTSSSSLEVLRRQTLAASPLGGSAANRRA